MIRDSLNDGYLTFRNQFKEKFLNEEFHISFTFQKCIYDLLFNCQIKGKYEYTGWNFIQDLKICEKLNDETVLYPIFLRVISKKTNPNTFSIKDRSLKTKVLLSKIFLTINADKFEFDSDEEKRWKLVAGLAHEFRHCLDMYIVKDKNLIKNDKSCISKISPKLQSILDDAQLIRINRVLYLFSKAEENARIQGTIYFLKEQKKDFSDEYKAMTIYQLISNSEPYHCLQEMEQLYLFYDLDFEEKNYECLFIFAYFYKENSGEKTKIKVLEEDILNYNSLDDMHKRTQAELMKTILLLNLSNFREQLYSLVAYHIA